MNTLLALSYNTWVLYLKFRNEGLKNCFILNEIVQFIYISSIFL